MPDLSKRTVPEATDHVDVLHGVEVADPFRWLEDTESEATLAFDAREHQLFVDYTAGLPQKKALEARFQQLWRYDDESTPEVCLKSDRAIVRTKTADQDKWVVHLQEADGTRKLLLDPNTWDETETLSGFYPSPDCTYAVFGKAKGGDENPVLRVMDLDTLEILPDTMAGWKQGWASWKHDNSGFWFSARPAPGTVPEGDENYYHRSFFHQLGTTMESDVVAFADDEVKEHYHGSWVSEDGRWLLQGRYQFSKNGLWLTDLSKPDAERMVVVDDLANEYDAAIAEGRLFLRTDWDAPTYRVMTTTVDKPGKEHWTELIPASDAKIDRLALIAGKLFLTYEDKAATRIAVHELDGTKLHDIELPTIGSASVSGHFSKPEVELSFSSYTVPTTIYDYDVANNTLTLKKTSPIDIDTTGMVVDQVWYESKDGTKVSMFLIRKDSMQPGQDLPVLLYGYGGFNISLNPGFSTVWATWLEHGGMVAIPNLRGGGEYGRAWHEAGMKEKKQNVFDDFHAAAEYLIEQKWTRPERLAIRGGSNGGLLVSAAMTQRPDLYRAVLCAVPLTDMIRFHTFGIANIWTTEYGSSEDPEMFPHLLKYSPYHNTKPGTDYPALLVVGSVNDARTDPVHARKFYAAAVAHDDDHGVDKPILLSLQKDSGHHGGVTIDTQADQYARQLGFLMEQLGME